MRAVSASSTLLPVVLVVEDDADLRDSLCMLLELDGFRSVGACNGQEALGYLRAHAAPCLILLDLMMPVMGGAEFREHQLADSALARVPTIVLSALDAAAQQQAVGAAAGYLPKPVPPDLLSRTVRRLCAA
jgi:CheY-like chemotaxis protein